MWKQVTVVCFNNHILCKLTEQFQVSLIFHFTFVPLRIPARLYHHEVCVSNFLLRCVNSVKITNYFEVKIQLNELALN
jgi:hypothetical protein